MLSPISSHLQMILSPLLFFLFFIFDICLPHASSLSNRNIPFLALEVDEEVQHLKRQQKKKKGEEADSWHYRERLELPTAPLEEASEGEEEALLPERRFHLQLVAETLKRIPDEVVVEHDAEEGCSYHADKKEHHTNPNREVDHAGEDSQRNPNHQDKQALPKGLATCFDTKEATDCSQREETDQQAKSVVEGDQVAGERNTMDKVDS